MDDLTRQTALTRRDWLKLSGSALAAGAALGHPGVGHAQTPKRGGTINLRLWDPPHWDPHLTISYKTHIAYSFTHSRLVKHKAGPSVTPGTFPIEGDLAESWTQPNETTYVFKLRQGVRWHNKPPVNGREVTAEDVVYTIERFRTVKGNANAYMLAVGRQGGGARQVHGAVHAEGAVRLVPRHAGQPARRWPSSRRSAWRSSATSRSPRPPSAPGPWMLDSYRPNVGFTLVRNPNYFVAGLPHIDRVEVFVDEDNASRMAAFLAGKYDLGWEFPGTINRVGLGADQGHAQAEAAEARRPSEFPSNVMSHIYMRTDKAPFSDVRVRRAMSMAIDRKGIIDAVSEGVGVLNPAVPAALKEWSIPVDQLGEGAPVLQVRSRRGQEAPRRGRPSQRLPGHDGLHHLRLHRARGHLPARPQVPEGRGHRRQAQHQGVRGLHLEHVLRQVRLAGLRPPDAASSSPTTSSSASTTRAS